MRVQIPSKLSRQTFVEQIDSDGLSKVALGFIERCSAKSIQSGVGEWSRVANLALQSTASGDPAEVLLALADWHNDMDLRGDIVHMLCLVSDPEEGLAALCCAGDFNIAGDQIGLYSAPLGSPAETRFDVDVIAAGDFSIGFGPRSLTLAEICCS